MTYQEFLAKLRETPRDWYVDYAGSLRRVHKNNTLCCPISALQNRRAAHALEVAADVGLMAADAYQIAVCADGHTQSSLYRDRVRADLLDACGLTESR